MSTRTERAVEYINRRSGRTASIGELCGAAGVSTAVDGDVPDVLAFAAELTDEGVAQVEPAHGLDTLFAVVSARAG